MDFKLFAILYQEALEYENFEMYTSKHGWQEWMDDFDEKNNLGDILLNIYNLSKMSIEEMRESSEMSQTKFAITYNIPIKIVKDWETGVAKIPDYTQMLIAYTFFCN
ncbi:helix-turn-helix domain-containing protein [Enterococcus sp. 5H]|uniref:helix-turn-helix domain-containing protein n=1 Tax=Enterococcus sp. 5H TaxID=1229490 RepID=UPI002303848E|nr:hypothetical protein [Enterococcus sp. 5H]MDA9472220.1 hypothetical protein [Enterococcus sp. 5H]